MKQNKKPKKQPYIRIIVNNKPKYFQVSKSRVMLGINSGFPFKQQYIFIDLDSSAEEESIRIAEALIKEQNLRKAIIMKSTNRHEGHHILSFSPKPFKDMIRIIMEYNSDEKHWSKAQDNGFATLRISSKDIPPKLIKEVFNFPEENTQINPNTKLNFYDFDAERAYLKLIEMENQKQVN